MKALYSLLFGIALLAGYGGGEGSCPGGTYAMAMKILGKEMQIQFELKPDNTFTVLPYKDGKKRIKTLL